MFAVRLTLKDLSRLGGLRTTPGVEAAVSGHAVWLRGGEVLLGLPHLELAHLGENGELVREGERIPYGRIPSDLAWQSLPDLLKVEAPSSTYPGQVVEDPAALTIAPSDYWRPAALLLGRLSAFRAFAETHSQAELGRFQFVCNGATEVLVRGEALPPMLGVPYTLDGGIALPAGYDWSPRLPADVLAEAFGLAPGDIALFRDGVWDVVGSSHWVQATRSAVRLSHEPGLQPLG